MPNSYLLEKFDNSCAYCGRIIYGTLKNPDMKYTEDHVVPLSKGGANSLYNKVPCCANCNRRKANSDMLNWYVKQREFTPERLDAIFAHLRSDPNNQKK